MTAVRLSGGQSLALGRKLAHGGEGAIYELVSESELLAKLYHPNRPVDEQLRRKLVAMVQMRSSELDAVSAWPLDLLHDGNGRCVGFLMSRVVGPGIFHKLSLPAEQRIAFPTIDYGFLLHVAMNVMRAASALHGAGCIIGDVNESNVFVLADGTIRFIDVDSFQVSNGVEVFTCNVGTPLYTPPELHGADFRGTVRTASHDSFGLAVLVFQLLVQGCHPFAGSPRDGRARTIEEAIKEGLYAFSPKSHARLVPPPGRLAPSALGELSELFERAFIGNGRPTSTEWMHALDRVRSRLRRCERNPRHAYLQGRPTCPLCELARDPLPHASTSQPAAVGVDGVPIAELIRQSKQMPVLQPLAERTRAPVLQGHELKVPSRPRELPQALPLPKQSDSPAFAALGTGVLTMLFGAVLYETAAISAIVAFGTGMALIVLAAALGHRSMNARVAAKAAVEADLKQRVGAVMGTFEPLKRAAQEALDRLSEVETRAASLDGSAQGMLRNVVTTAKAIADSLVGAEARLHASLHHANSSYRDHQLAEHLENCLLAKAEIPGIGPSRKAVLASFGIETAADISRQSVGNISGFGPHLTERLVDWRRGCESMFTPRGSSQAPPAWLDRIKVEHADHCRPIAVRLRDTVREHQRMYGVLDRQLASAAEEVDACRLAYREALTAVHKAG